MKITNAADIRTFLKGFYDQHITALNGMLDKLPEPMRAEFTRRVAPIVAATRSRRSLRDATLVVTCRFPTRRRFARTASGSAPTGPP